MLFGVEDRGDVHVYRATPDAATEQVLGGRRAVMGYDLAGEVLAFVAATPTTLPEVFVRGADGAERQLTSFGAAFLKAVPPSEPEHFTVLSPAGDVELDAWLVQPPNAGELEGGAP